MDNSFWDGKPVGRVQKHKPRQAGGVGSEVDLNQRICQFRRPATIVPTAAQAVVVVVVVVESNRLFMGDVVPRPLLPGQAR